MHMVYRIPGTNSDPEIPQELYDIAAQETGLPSDHKAVAHLAHLLFQRDRLSEEVESNEVDPKTGVFSSRYFCEYANKELIGLSEGRRRQDRANSALVFVFDVEKFKDINFKFGHHGGDKRLMATGDFLKDIIREGGDLPGRIGGDEFAIVVFYDHEQIGHEDMLREMEERIANPQPEKHADLPSLRWNHAFFTNGDLITNLLEAADVKGKPLADGSVRSHSHTPEQNQKALELALSNSSPLLQ